MWSAFALATPAATTPTPTCNAKTIDVVHRTTNSSVAARTKRSKPTQPDNGSRFVISLRQSLRVRSLNARKTPSGYDSICRNTRLHV